MKLTLSLSSLTSSTLLWDAASISVISNTGSHPIVVAIIRANEVLPTPLGPENKYA